jgi:CHAT domain-containing protein
VLNKMGLVYHRQGRYSDAVSRLLQARQIAHLNNYANGEAEAFRAIGQLYHSQGKYADSITQYIYALAIFRREQNQDGEASTLTQLASVFVSNGRFQEATENYNQALELAQTLHDRTTEASALSGIATVYRERGHYTAALANFQQSLEIVRRLHDPALEAEIILQLAQVYLYQGGYSSALATCQQARDIAREIENRSLQAQSIGLMAQIYQNQAMFGQALERYQEASLIMRSLNDRDGESAVLKGIASVYQDQGRYAQALDAYQAALKLVHRIESPAEEGAILIKMASIYEILNDEQQALALYNQALTIMREMDNYNGHVTSLLGLGRAYLSLGLSTESSNIVTQVLKMASERTDKSIEAEALAVMGDVLVVQGSFTVAIETYESALILLQGIGSPAKEGQITGKIAYAFEQQEEWAQSLAYYETAMAALETVRLNAGSEFGRASFIDQYVDLFNQAIQLNYDLGKYESAFLISERSRARAFQDSLATGRITLSDNDASELLTQELEAFTARQNIRDALLQAENQVPLDSGLISDLEAQLQAAEDLHDGIIREIEERQDSLIDLIPTHSTVQTLQEIQAPLDSQTTIVSYWMLKDQTLAFILTKNNLEVIGLPGITRQRIETIVADLFEWFNRENSHPRSLRLLYQQIMQPILPYLQTPYVMIVPHQQLHYVPFAALTDGVNYFGNQYTLSVIPTVSSLPYLTEKASTKVNEAVDAALVMGDPMVSSIALEPLVYAASEAEAVAEMLQVPSYVAAAATESILRHKVADASVLHLATHGKYDPEEPLKSVIYLAATADEDDGLLEVGEVFALPLKKVQLVTLSACETNIGKLSRGDELVGLTRAFFYAGTPTVISSLWLVDDAATERLMIEFYRNWLKKDMDKATALRVAQIEVQHDPRWQSPYYWSGFVLNGLP